MGERMSLLITDELPQPARVRRPNGKVAYTVTQPEQIDSLPWHHLCALADATHKPNPVAFYVRWPGEFRPLSII